MQRESLFLRSQEQAMDRVHTAHRQLEAVLGTGQFDVGSVQQFLAGQIGHMNQPNVLFYQSDDERSIGAINGILKRHHFGVVDLGGETQHSYSPETHTAFVPYTPDNPLDKLNTYRRVALASAFNYTECPFELRKTDDVYWGGWALKGNTIYKAGIGFLTQGFNTTRYLSPFFHVGLSEYLAAKWMQAAVQTNQFDTELDMIHRTMTRGESVDALKQTFEYGTLIFDQTTEVPLRYIQWFGDRVGYSPSTHIGMTIDVLAASDPEFIQDLILARIYDDDAWKRVETRVNTMLGRYQGFEILKSFDIFEGDMEANYKHVMARCLKYVQGLKIL